MLEKIVACRLINAVGENRSASADDATRLLNPLPSRSGNGMSFTCLLHHFSNACLTIFFSLPLFFFSSSSSQ